MKTALFIVLLCGLVVVKVQAQSREQAQKKSSIRPYALVFGNVFDPAARTFAGAEVEIRREHERKPRWRTQSDARGEFAIRLPAGAARYVVTLRARGFVEELRTVTIENEERVDLLFRLQPLSGGKR